MTTMELADEARRTLAARLVAVSDELRAVSRDYATALLLATEAEIAARREAECLVAIRADVAVRAHGFVRETTRGDKAILAPERDALVAATIQRDPTYDVPAATALSLREEAERARCRATVLDQRQKALRAELAALTALLGDGI